MVCGRRDQCRGQSAGGLNGDQWSGTLAAPLYLRKLARDLLTQRFTFDRERNLYVCPADKLLTTIGNVSDDHARCATVRRGTTEGAAASPVPCWAAVGEHARRWRLKQDVQRVCPRRKAPNEHIYSNLR